jgi:hypothetical protein
MPWGSPSSSSGGYTTAASWSVPGPLVTAWHRCCRTAHRYYTQLQAEACWVFRGLRVGRKATFPFSSGSSAATPERLPTSPDRPDQRD